MAKDIWGLLANPKLNKCLPEGLLGAYNLRVRVVSVSERIRVIKLFPEHLAGMEHARIL